MRIHIVSYRSSWPDDFNTESILLRSRLQHLLENIHHIGSTSIPGMSAKPIIDIMIEVVSLDTLDSKPELMKSLGYEAKGEFGLAGRRFFTKGFPNKTHHLHAYKGNDVNIARHLAFRDYLLSHPDIMQDYANLKYKLVKTVQGEAEKYSAGKNGFIKYYESLALKHNNNI